MPVQSRPGSDLAQREPLHPSVTIATRWRHVHFLSGRPFLPWRGGLSPETELRLLCWGPETRGFASWPVTADAAVTGHLLLQGRSHSEDPSCTEPSPAGGNRLIREGPRGTERRLEANETAKPVRPCVVLLKPIHFVLSQLCRLTISTLIFQLLRVCGGISEIKRRL